MGLIDKLLGREEQPDAPAPASRTQSAPARTDDERAVERYRYLLRTAPPEQIEQAHAEAFARLSPDQRKQVLAELSSDDPTTPQDDDPTALARTATRAEMRQPGTLERSFGGRGAGIGGGLGMGSMIGGTLLASVAGAFIGTAIADALVPDQFGEGSGDDQASDGAGSEGAGSEETGAGVDDPGMDVGADLGGGDFGGGDFDI